MRHEEKMAPTDINYEKKGSWEEHQQWRYWYSGKVQPMFAVYPDPPRQIPKTLFKYYALNEHSVDALTHLYIYASHPNQLNDPSDCSEDLLDFSTASLEDLKALYEPFFDRVLALCGNLDGVRSVSSENFKIRFYQKIGIISLCGSCDNMTMWSNYTSNVGFCVEFDTVQFPFRYYGPFPIHYVNEFEPFFINKNMANALLIQTNIKLDEWKFENEFRVIVSNPEGYAFELYEKNGQKSERFNFGDEHDRKMRYSLSAIKSVTLAVNFLQQQGVNVHTINNAEIEIVVLNNPLVDQILNFLSNPQIKFAKYLARIQKTGKITRLQVELIRISKNMYRAIEVVENKFINY